MFRPPPAPPLTSQQCIERAQGRAPALMRRMAAFLYEGVLLFGVVMLVGLVFGIAADQRHGLQHRSGLQAAVFLMLSLYFIWFWTHGGQTLAMKTWHLRLVSDRGTPLSLRQAAARYLLMWLWIAPSLMLAWLAQWHESGTLLGLMVVWIALYASLSFLMPQRQFVHDAICRTRVINTRP